MVKLDSESSWHLDKKVPISIIATILFQTAGLIWWASKMDSRVASLEEADRRSDQHALVTDAKLEGLRGDRDRLVRMETQLEGIQRSIQRLEARLLEPGGGNGNR